MNLQKWGAAEPVKVTAAPVKRMHGRVGESRLVLCVRKTRHDYEPRLLVAVRTARQRPSAESSFTSCSAARAARIASAAGRLTSRHSVRYPACRDGRADLTTRSTTISPIARNRFGMLARSPPDAALSSQLAAFAAFGGIHCGLAFALRGRTRGQPFAM